MANLWQRFIQLKAWQRIAILGGLFLIAISSALSDTSEESKTIEPTASPSASATVSVQESASPTASASPSASESPTPETPLEFRFSALRDLKDLRKDVNDAKAGISENGLGKFYWNVVEIQFNMTQLESLLPREEYADRWNSKLALLKKAVDAIDTSDENLTISKARSQLNAILNAIPALEKVAKSLAN
jgi:hypothetical protein